jgi:hypothetical protein
MNVDIKELRTGWFDVGIGLTSSEIRLLIERLQRLQEQRENFDHFHFRNAFKEAGGVADIEIYRADENTPSNMQIE